MFTKHQKHQRSNPAPWIKIGISGRGTNWLRATISMSRAVCEHIGVKVGEQVEFGLGSGCHDGWMEIRKCTDGEGYTLQRRGARDGVLQWAVTAGALDAKKNHQTVKITNEDMQVITTHDGSTPVVRVEIPASIMEDQ